MEILHHIVDRSYFVIFSVGPLIFKFTRQTWALLYSVLFLSLIGIYVGRLFRTSPVPAPAGFLMTCFEQYVEYVRDNIVYPILGEETGEEFLDFFLTLFAFLLFTNLLGLVPEVSIPGTEIVIYPMATATSNIWIVSSLALLVLLVGMTEGVKRFGFFGYLRNYVPGTVPDFIAVILLPLEFCLTLVRHIILVVRLLANVVAGHGILLGVLGVAVFLMESFQSMLLGWPASFAATLFALFIYLLEILTSVVQAYVFTILSVLYMDLQIHRH